jgi:hypothetical protein
VGNDKLWKASLPSEGKGGGGGFGNFYFTPGSPEYSGVLRIAPDLGKLDPDVGDVDVADAVGGGQDDDAQGR